MAWAVEGQSRVHQPSVQGRVEPESGGPETKHHALLLQVSCCMIACILGSVVWLVRCGENSNLDWVKQYIIYICILFFGPTLLQKALNVLKSLKCRLLILLSRMWKGLYNRMEKSIPPCQSAAHFLSAVKGESQQLKEELTNHQEVPSEGTANHKPLGFRQGIQYTETHPATTPP